MSVNRRDAAPVSRGAVMRYLADRGWARAVSRDGRLLKYSLADDAGGNQVDLIFSKFSTTEVESDEVFAAIEVISQLYDIPENEVSRSIISLSSDIIFSKIPDEYVRHESIEFGIASSYISGMKNFLASAATTEITGARFFPRTLKEAITYAKGCRFGHTFKGSFGFVVESPVGYNDSPTMPQFYDVVPFGRKVMRRVYRAFESFSLAVELDDPEPLVSDDAGMSANMCDDVIGLLEDTGISKVEISILMSPEWSDGGGEYRRSFGVEQRYVDLLKGASAALRREEMPKKETVIGRVVRLETDADPQDMNSRDPNREVSISWDSAEYGPVRVLVYLNPRDYLLAVDAHRSSQLFAVTGMLRRRGRGWAVDDASEARLVG